MLTNLFRLPEPTFNGYESIRLLATRRLVMTVTTFVLTVAVTLCLSANVSAQHFQQTNLVSDVP